jgi:hypothetical protein
MFWSEIISDLLQLCAYMSFFTYIHMVYALPLHIVRDMYITVRRLQKHYTEYLRYKQVIKTMNQRFPDATVEELDRMDRTCIICREDMRHAKKLSCGHVFHSKCLLSWLKRQLSCPTCRAPVDLSSDNPSGTSVGANVVGEQGQVQNPVERRQMENGIANPPRGRTLRVGLRVNIGNRTAEWNPFQEDLFQTLHEARHSTLMHSSPCPPLPRFENLMRNEQQSGWNGVLSNNNNNNRMGSQQTERNHIRFEDIAQQMQKIRDYMRVL